MMPTQLVNNIKGVRLDLLYIVSTVYNSYTVIGTIDNDIRRLGTRVRESGGYDAVMATWSHLTLITNSVKDARISYR